MMRWNFMVHRFHILPLCIPVISICRDPSLLKGVFSCVPAVLQRATVLMRRAGLMNRKWTRLARPSSASCLALSTRSALRAGSRPTTSRPCIRWSQVHGSTGRVTRLYGACYMALWGMLHGSMGHVTWVYGACYMALWGMLHGSRRHVTWLYGACYTALWGMLHDSMRHVTRLYGCDTRLYGAWYTALRDVIHSSTVHDNIMNGNSSCTTDVVFKRQLHRY